MPYIFLTLLGGTQRRGSVRLSAPLLRGLPILL
uniref:40S ribosomal protein S5, putative n=1 Tax=Arundo donax TaxID=35708 RepID=A0A0A9E9D5_ARUDO